ncbi:hypothetical protein D3C87_1519850 [compost metagenome]
MSSQVRSDIYASLRVAVQLISDATEKLHEARFPSAEEDRLRLGRAMAELLCTLDSFCASAPDLRKKRAEATKLEVLHNRLFQDVMMEAQLFEATGHFEAAIARYTQFLAACPSHTHRALVQSELQRLRLLASHWSAVEKK